MSGAEGRQGGGVSTETSVVRDLTSPDGAVPFESASARRRRPVRARNQRLAVSLGSLVVVVALWQLIGPHVNPIYVSYPSAIARAFGHMVNDGSLWPAFVATMKPMVLGYVGAVLVGVPLGLVLGRYRMVESVLGMYVTAGYATPMVALIPLFVLWFGLGFTVKVWVVFTMSIFPVVINTWAGAKLVPRTLIEVGKSFVAPGHTIMRKIIVPCTLPYIMTGLRLGVGRAVIAVIIAEFYTAIGGLGGIIINSQQQFDTASMMVPILILLALGIGLTGLIGYVEARLAPWQSALSGRDGGG